MPDGLSASIEQKLKEKSAVLPVPVFENPAQALNLGLAELATIEKGDATTIDRVWAHRWEFDKQPEVFFTHLKDSMK